MEIEFYWINKFHFNVITSAFISLSRNDVNIIFASYFDYQFRQSYDIPSIVTNFVFHSIFTFAANLCYKLNLLNNEAYGYFAAFS